jgi:RHS repeat-associated protein
MKKAPAVRLTSVTGPGCWLALLATLMLPQLLNAATCFGPFLDYDYAAAACINQREPNPDADCINEQPQFTCGGVYHAVKLYRDCIGTSAGGCSFPYYAGGCPAGQWVDPETGICTPVEDNPVPAKNFGPCRHAPSDYVGNPVKVSTGNNYLRESDHEGFGRGVLRFDRMYNSGLALMDPPQPAWRHTYERRIRETLAGSRKFRAADRHDGSSIYFHRASSTSRLWLTDADVRERLEHTAVSGIIVEYRLVLPDGSLERYDGNGVLQSITDIAGNSQNLIYDTDGRLERVESSTGEYLAFGYDLQGRQATLTDHTGRVWKYTYDDNGNPQYVYYPDGSQDTHANNPYRRYHYEDAAFHAGLTGISDLVQGREQRYSTWTYDELGRATASYHGPQTDIPGERIAGTLISYDAPFTRTVTGSRGDVRSYTVSNGLGRYRLDGITRPGCSGCADGESGFSYGADTNDLLASSVNGIVTEYGEYTVRGEPRFRIEAKGTPEERRTDYTYDSRFHDRVATRDEPSVNPDGRRITRFTYDDSGNRTTETVTGYTLDAQGAWTAATRTTSYRYDGPLRQLSQIDGPRTDVADITVLRYYADDSAEGGNRARLSEVEDASGVLVRSNLQYTPTGRVSSEERPNGLRLSYTYYPGSDRLETLTRSDGVSSRVSRWTYLETGEIESITSAYGTEDAATLTLGYDMARRLTRVMDGLGNYVEFKLDTQGNREEENVHDNTGTLRKSLRQTFDVYSHLDTTYRANESMDYDYAPNGVILRKTTGRGHVTVFDYDGLNRLVASTQDLGSLNARALYDYDAGGRLARVTDPENATTSYRYDDFGNLLEMAGPDTGTTRYTHDKAGNLRSRVDGMGREFTYRYDALNRLVFLDAPGSSDDISYAYDDCANGTGRLCSITMGGSVVSYRYDAFGKVVAHQQLAYSHDAADRLARIRYPSGAVVTYHHDAAGQISRVDLEADGKTTSLAGDIVNAPFGGIAGLTYGNGKTLSQLYDSAYRLTRQQVPAVLELDYSLYDAAGNLERRDDAIDRDSSQYSYDALERLDTASGSFGERDYDYDLNDNRTRLLSGPAATTYRYSPASNRIESETGWLHNLDTNGNTVGRMKDDGSGEGRSFAYTAHNRLASVTDHMLVTSGKGRHKATLLQDIPVSAYAYNGLGQRIRKEAAGGAVTRFLYGLDGALMVELDEAGSVHREYVYLDGRLLAVLEQAAANSGTGGVEVVLDDGDPGTGMTGSWNAKSSNKAHEGDYLLADGGGNRYRWMPGLDAGTYDVYVWYVKHRMHSTVPYRIVHAGQVSAATVDQSRGGGGWHQIGSGLEFDGSGNEYVEVSDANGKTTADAVRFVNVNSGTDSGTVTNVYYVHHDHLGTPLAMTDAQASVVWRASHDPYGMASLIVDAVELNVRFPGQYFDQETGLHYNYARYYDPKTGRYLTSDPIGLKGGLNIFAYALGNPIGSIDPSGLKVTGKFAGFVINDINVDFVGTEGQDPPATDSQGMTIIGYWILNGSVQYALKIRCEEEKECSDSRVWFTALHGAYSRDNMRLPIKDSWLPFVYNLAAKAAAFTNARRQLLDGVERALGFTDPVWDVMADLVCKGTSRLPAL